MACKKCKKNPIFIIFWLLISFLARLDLVLTKTNWQATWYWTRKKGYLIWIGGHGSDYTQSCYQAGSCYCRLLYGVCVQRTSTCACKCPTPLANSHQVSSDCGTWGFACGAPTACPCHCAGTCSGSQTCSYSCDTGYSWNGSQCVAIGGIIKDIIQDNSLLFPR